MKHFKIEISGDDCFTEQEFLTHLHGPKYKSILEEISNLLRNRYKYQNKDAISCTKLRKHIYDLCRGEGVELS